MFRDFNIRWIAALALLFFGVFAGDAVASISRGDFPGWGHGGRQGVVPVSNPDPAQGMKPESLEEASIQALQEDPRETDPVTAGSGCETPHPGGGTYCVHPGLQKSRGQ